MLQPNFYMAFLCNEKTCPIEQLKTNSVPSLPDFAVTKGPYQADRDPAWATQTAGWKLREGGSES